MKTCSTCGESKELSEFHKKTLADDGLSYVCKSCTKQMNKVRYERYSEKIKSQQTKRSPF